MSARRRLPTRRLAITERCELNGRTWHVSVGFDGAGRAREIFIAGPKIGSDLDAIVKDAAVVTSVLLQSGMAADQIGQNLGRENGGPASCIGKAMEMAAQIEREEGPAVLAAMQETSP